MKPLDDCPAHQTRAALERAGLRPTRQRLAIAWLLFAHGPRHICAEQLHAEARKAGFNLSLATVYNTLHQFEEAGLVRRLYSVGPKILFDTNLQSHSHFLDVDSLNIFDADIGLPSLTALSAPPNFKIVGYDLIIRLKRVPRSPMSRNSTDNNEARD